MGLPEQASGGKYEILDRLAVGGMAEIYLAKALGIEGFEKYVVLKRILPQHAEDPRFVEMFLDEARLAALLHHNNIAQVYDIGQLDGAYFFTMEYLHGEDVRGLFRKLAPMGRRLELQHALTIAAGVAAGLHYAHDMRGSDGAPLEIVHRDVSPSNVVITYAGAVKIVDFGVAHATQRTTETKTGGFKGKLSYLSPEQCVGERVDRRSDVFSLGILLYEMTAMRRLFRRAGQESDYVIMDRIVKGVVTPPSSFVDGYPPELEAIVLRALAVDRDERYPTAGEMLADIEAFAAQERIPLSQQALSRYMQNLFGNPPEPWLVDDDDEDETVTLEDDGRLARAAEQFLRAQTPPGGVPIVDALPEGTIAVATRTGERPATPLPLPAPPEEDEPPVEQPVAVSVQYPQMSDERSAPSAAPTPVQRQSTVPVGFPRRRRRKAAAAALVAAVAAVAVAAVALFALRGGDADEAPAATPAPDAAPVPAEVADAAAAAAPAAPDAAPVAVPAAPDAAPAPAETRPARIQPKPKRKPKRKPKPKRKRPTKGLLDRDW